MADFLQSPREESGLRQMAFCHECQRGEWYTSDHELIEENSNHPPEAATARPPLFHHHDHYRDHDHDQYSHYQSIRTGRDERGTLYYTSGPLSDSHFVRARYFLGPDDRRTPASTAEGLHEPMQILDHIMGRGLARESLQRTPLSRSFGSDEANRSRNDDRNSAGPSYQGRNRPHTETFELTMALGGGGDPPRFGRGRFVHNPNAGFGPRDANHAQPRHEPVDALNSIITSILYPQGLSGHRGSSGPDDTPHAFTAMLTSLLNTGVAGDAVYTQEALDQVISQLMEQHTSGNAPGPAPEDAIAALPKKKVDRSMLDNKDEGDCSVCMDTVQVGSEVTNLPCGHWFHEHCVSMWLREHNTCPICRKGITPGSEETSQPRSPRAGSSPNDRPERPHPRSENEGSGAGLSGRVRQWFSGSN